MGKINRNSLQGFLSTIFHKDIEVPGDSLQKRLQEMEKEPHQSPSLWQIELGNNGEFERVANKQSWAEKRAFSKRYFFGDIERISNYLNDTPYDAEYKVPKKKNEKEIVKEAIRKMEHSKLAIKKIDEAINAAYSGERFERVQRKTEIASSFEGYNDFFNPQIQEMIHGLYLSRITTRVGQTKAKEAYTLAELKAREGKLPRSFYEQKERARTHAIEAGNPLTDQKLNRLDEIYKNSVRENNPSLIEERVRSYSENQKQGKSKTDLNTTIKILNKYAKRSGLKITPIK